MITDEQLLKRAVTGARARYTHSSHMRWVAVMYVFKCGSSEAKDLCVRFELDPEEMVK